MILEHKLCSSTRLPKKTNTRLYIVNDSKEFVAFLELQKQNMVW